MNLALTIKEARDLNVLDQILASNQYCGMLPTIVENYPNSLLYIPLEFAVELKLVSADVK